MSTVQRPPFHGMLSPNQMLFSWFAEITFGLLGENVGELKVQFGDVYLVKKKDAVTNKTNESNQSKGMPVTSTEGVDSSQKSNISLTSGKQLQLQEAAISDFHSDDHSLIPPKGVEKLVFEEIDSQHLILVISPACDLQRVKNDYEVLCVKGSIVKSTPNLFDFLDQRTLGKDKNSGKYRHLLQRSAEGGPRYLLVEWQPSKITTISITNFRDQGYSRLARLNELFSQEIKEDALREVGRVGVQVDPAFNVGLGATIAYRPKKKTQEYVEIPDSDTISGLFTSGNSNNNPRIVVSEEFLDFFENVVRAIERSDDPALEDVLTKLKVGLKKMLEKGGEGFELSKNNQCQIDKAGFTLKYTTEYIRESGDSGFCGVYFYPRGAVKDPANDITETPNSSDIDT